MDPYEIILICGSTSDAENANKILEVWNKIGLNYKVSVCSCHKHGGGKFADFMKSISSKIIVFVGGMSLAAPGLIEVINKIIKRYDSIVFAIPTDNAALSAVQDLPKGTALITSGLNQVSLSHSLVNSALATARLTGMLVDDPDRKKIIMDGQQAWYEKNWEENPLIENVELDENGLMIIKKK